MLLPLKKKTYQALEQVTDLKLKVDAKLVSDEFVADLADLVDSISTLQQSIGADVSSLVENVRTFRKTIKD
jgi:hypothetical protein